MNYAAYSDSVESSIAGVHIGMAEQAESHECSNEIEAAAEWVDTDSLVEWDKNPRKNDTAVSRVAALIKRFGFGAPIVARLADRCIIAGHTRLKAAKQLGLPKVPVRFLALDPADAAMLAVADNKVHEAASWDDQLLRKIADEEGWSCDTLDLLGFDEESIEQLLCLAADTESSCTDESEPADSGTRAHYLRFQSLRLPMTEEEERSLKLKLDLYKAEHGTHYGAAALMIRSL